MNKPPPKPGSSGGDLFPLMMANAFMWAIAIIASLIILHDTGDYVRLFPILGGGACMASVGCSITWKRRKENRQGADQTWQFDR